MRREIKAVWKTDEPLVIGDTFTWKGDSFSKPKAWSMTKWTEYIYYSVLEMDPPEGLKAASTPTFMEEDMDEVDADIDDEL